MRVHAIVMLALLVGLSPGCDSGGGSGGGADTDVSAPGPDTQDAVSDAPPLEDVSPRSDIVEDTPQPGDADVAADVSEDIPEEVPCEPVCSDCAADDGCGGVCVDDMFCDDGNPCTDDSCDPESGCVNDANEFECDDGDPCTIADTCKGGDCIGAPRDCQDANPCTFDSCDVDTGECVNDAALADESACDDGNPCTGDDVCLAGACAGALLPLEELTLEDCLCDQTDGACAPLEDGDLCNGTLYCAMEGAAEGTCQIDPDTILACDDDIECTLDGCAPDTGCTFDPVDAACDDGNMCTDDVCVASEGCSNAAVADGLACGAPGWECVGGACACVPACDGKSCGDDGCGGTCGDCGCGEVCEDDGVCLFTACDGVECGDDGCGGTCGDCGCGETCDAGSCLFEACDGKDCGDDGCGGTCGSCGCGETCDGGLCLFGACDGVECGDDGCGGSCGGCADGEACEDGACVEVAGACPPSGPYGTNIGDVAADAVVMDCDGVPYSIHDLCNYQAAWIFVFSGW